MLNARRVKMDLRRSGQRARVYGFLFIAPPTDPRFAIPWLSLKTGHSIPGCAPGPRSGVGRSKYDPHQGNREKARRRSQMARAQA